MVATRDSPGSRGVLRSLLIRVWAEMSRRRCSVDVRKACTRVRE